MSEHSFRFAFVSNSRAIAEAVREYAQGRGMGMEIRLASMEKALPVARELLENGVEVILGGGGTGRLLRGRLQRPVVTISNDHLSVLRSLMQARQYSSSIAVTCYERIPEWVGPFAELLHISTRAYSDLERGKYSASALTMLFFMSELQETETLALLNDFRKVMHSALLLDEG